MSPSLSWIDPDRLKQSWARASSDVGHGSIKLEGDWVHFEAPSVNSQPPKIPDEAERQDDTQPPPTALPHAESETPQATHVEAMPGPTTVPQTPPPPRRIFQERIERELSFPSNEITAPLSSANEVARQQSEPPTQFTSQRPNSYSRSARPTVSPEAVSDLALEVATQMGSGLGGFDPLPPIGLSGLPEIETPALPNYGSETFIALRLPKFLAWFEQVTLPIAYYIADAHGLPVHLENMTETQAVGAVALTRSLRPLRRIIGSDRVNVVSLTLGDGRITHTIWADTPLGRMALGLEASKSLSAEQLNEVGRALRTLFETGVSR